MERKTEGGREGNVNLIPESDTLKRPLLCDIIDQHKTLGGGGGGGGGEVHICKCNSLQSFAFCILKHTFPIRTYSILYYVTIEFYYRTCGV